MLLKAGLWSRSSFGLDNNMKPIRIMIVDDEAPFTRLLKLGLEQKGRYLVQTENDPHRALRAAEQFLPDLVLMDVMMPDLDGGVLAAQFQASPVLGQVPIIFLTAAAKREEVRAHQGKIGGFPFLAKPVNVKEITHCIHQHLAA